MSVRAALRWLVLTLVLLAPAALFLFCGSSQSNPLPIMTGDAGGDEMHPTTFEAGTSFVFAVIGDYGVCGTVLDAGPAGEAGEAGIADAGDAAVSTCVHEEAVAAMVHTWKPDAVFTTGDNDYGPMEGPGDGTEIPGDQRPYADLVDAGVFFPAMGVVDWAGNLDAALGYFRVVPYPPYYSKAFSNVITMYVVDSNPGDPVGDQPGSLQAEWLSSHVAMSGTAWNIVLANAPVYSSCAGSNNGANGGPDYSWVAAPGVQAIFNGQERGYEHLLEPAALDASVPPADASEAGVASDAATKVEAGPPPRPYFVIGASGVSLIPDCDAAAPGSVKRVFGRFGALKLTVTGATLSVAFYDESGGQVDSVTLTH